MLDDALKVTGVNFRCEHRAAWAFSGQSRMKDQLIDVTQCKLTHIYIFYVSYAHLSGNSHIYIYIDHADLHTYRNMQTTLSLHFWMHLNTSNILFEMYAHKLVLWLSKFLH